MVAALKKLVPEDFKGKFAAWWDGKEYHAPSEDDADGDELDADAASDAVEDDAPARKKSAKPVETSAKPPVSAAASRVAALETLWGEGRFSPGSAELYSRISEGLQAGSYTGDQHFGVLNADPALTTHIMGATGMTPIIAEWRTACAEQFRVEMPDFELMRGDLDRPPFEPGALKLLVSVDAFAYADHKSGLAVRALRSLAAGGQWIVIDTVRGKPFGSLAPAFASSWAEPQISATDDISDVCEAAGFEMSSAPDDVSGDVIQASRSAFERFGNQLDDKLANKLSNVNKSVFVRELAWETEAWKWRQRALAGELLHVKVWRFRKPASAN